MLAQAIASAPDWLKRTGKIGARVALPVAIAAPIVGELMSQDPTADGPIKLARAAGAGLGSFGVGALATAASAPFVGPAAPLVGALAAGLLGAPAGAGIAENLIPGAADRAFEKSLQQQVRAAEEKAAADIRIQQARAQALAPIEAKLAEQALILEIQKRGLLAPLEERAQRMQAFNTSLANLTAQATPIAQSAVL